MLTYYSFKKYINNYLYNKKGEIMFDIQKTKKNFNKYVEKYDYINNPDMNRKYYHSFRIISSN